MEHPPLVAGQTVRFAVHLTQLADFSALNAGRPSIEMTPETGGAPSRCPAPIRCVPAPFASKARCPPAGRYRWALLVDAPGSTDRHDLGARPCSPTRRARSPTPRSSRRSDAAAIAYLKEQQWTNPFATALVRDGEVRTSIRVPAAIEPVTGGEAIVAAPADGRLPPTTLPSVGDRVRAGQVLGRLEPRLAETGDDRATLAAAVAEAQAALDAAHGRTGPRRAAARGARRAGAARRRGAARGGRRRGAAEGGAGAAGAARSVLGTGGGAASGNAFVLRAPIAGRVAEVFAALGASYDEGAPLFRIVRTDRVELQAQIPPPMRRCARTSTAWRSRFPGRAEPIVLEPDHVHDAGVIDPKTRALPVQIEVENRGGQLLIGQTGTAVIYTGGTQRVPVVPREAVLMEAGRPYVFVQVGGESFARRFVDVASRDGDLVGIRSGIKPGERVVTRGAYEIQLASAAKGLPAEGHVH